MDRPSRPHPHRSGRQRRAHRLVRAIPRQGLSRLLLLAQGRRQRRALSLALGCLQHLPPAARRCRLRRHGHRHRLQRFYGMAAEFRAARPLRHRRRYLHARTALHWRKSRARTLRLRSAARCLRSRAHHPAPLVAPALRRLHRHVDHDCRLVAHLLHTRSVRPHALFRHLLLRSLRRCPAPGPHRPRNRCQTIRVGLARPRRAAGPQRLARLRRLPRTLRPPHHPWRKPVDRSRLCGLLPIAASPSRPQPLAAQHQPHRLAASGRCCRLPYTRHSTQNAGTLAHRWLALRGRSARLGGAQTPLPPARRHGPRQPWAGTHRPVHHLSAG